MSYLSLFRSELKFKIMISLLKGERKLAELRDDLTGTRDTTILHALEEFEKLNLITKTQNIYKLTSIGIMEAQICKEYLASIEVLEKFKDFWLLHNVTAIPPRLLLNLGALKDSELVQTQASELGLVHETFVNLIQTSKKLRGTSPIFHPDFILFFGQLLLQGSTIELIMTEPVFEKILEFADYELIRDYIERGNLKIHIKDELEIALAVTNNIFSLGLFTLTGKYDDTMDLVSFSQEAIAWGEQLYEETLKSSRIIDLESFKKK